MRARRKLLVGIAGVTLVLVVTAAWATDFTNPVVSSDPKHNTAGGTAALAGVEASSGTENTGFGFHALTANTTGYRNTALGSEALPTNTTGADNVAVGTLALFYNNGGGNVAVGSLAMYGNAGGSANTAIGIEALYSNTSGYENAAVGGSAMRNNVSGGENAAFGSKSLEHNTTGNNNTAVGYKALFFNVAGDQNSALGKQSLNKVRGSGNTGLGFQALVNLITGNSNVALGNGAGNALTSGGNNIYVGNPGAASESNVTRIGNTQSKVFVAGIAGVNVSNAVEVMVDSATGQLGILGPSSQRYKDDVRDMADQSERLRQLRPVTFRYKADETQSPQYGLLAEEVAQVYPEMVVRDREGRIENVQYPKLIPLLLKQIQLQEAQIRLQQTQAAADRARIEVLEDRLSHIEAANQQSNVASR